MGCQQLLRAYSGLYGPAARAWGGSAGGERRRGAKSVSEPAWGNELPVSSRSSGKTSLKRHVSPAFSAPVSLTLRDQHPPACSRWLKQQQQLGAQGDELPKYLPSFSGETAAGRGCPDRGVSSRASMQCASVETHPPLAVLLCSHPARGSW